MAETQQPSQNFDDLVGVVETLLAPGGCPWDREQTHSTLRKYLLEETYELIEAVDADDPKAMTEELGDLLVHVLFHAEMAKAAGEFELGDIVHSAAVKMIGRHPHVFGDTEVETAEDVLQNWDELKRKEKGGIRRIADAVPKAMPALSYAAELQNRVERAKVEWRDPGDSRIPADVVETVKASTEQSEQEQAVGEFLFETIADLRKFGIDPETAVKRYALKFRDRVEVAENTAGNRPISELSAEDRQQAWAESA
jgi:tetrapyrrole methylase family protein/MazG family protein